MFLILGHIEKKVKPYNDWRRWFKKGVFRTLRKNEFIYYSFG